MAEVLSEILGMYVELLFVTRLATLRDSAKNNACIKKGCILDFQVLIIFIVLNKVLI